MHGITIYSSYIWTIQARTRSALLDHLYHDLLAKNEDIFCAVAGTSIVFVKINYRISLSPNASDLIVTATQIHICEALLQLVTIMLYFIIYLHLRDRRALTLFNDVPLIRALSLYKVYGDVSI